MKTIAEKALPLRVLSESAINDVVKTGHPGNIHPWWSRSPIYSSAALLYSTLVDSDDGLIAEIANGDFKNARQALAQNQYPKIVDCFSGFGGLTNAAQQLGLKTVSSDLNSVAVILTKAIAEIPEQFANISPVHPGAQIGTISGSRALAEDVEYYGKLLEKRTAEMLNKHYKSIDGINPVSFIWSRTVKCPNPLCKCETPLASTFVLNKGKNREFWAEPIQQNGELVFHVHKGKCPEDKESNKISQNGAVFKCAFCGETITDEYVKSMGNTASIGNALMAVCLEQEGSKT